jgi:hypothetical protein
MLLDFEQQLIKAFPAVALSAGVFLPGFREIGGMSSCPIRLF